MTPDQARELMHLSTAVRKLFQVLGQAETDLHAETGVSGGMRAVLESLTGQGPMTVPELARLRPVSRQHIQALVNQLLAAGLVEMVDNPAHRRSRLVSPTEAGRTVFGEMRGREKRALQRVELSAPAEQLQAARQTLETMCDAFAGPRWRALLEQAKRTDDVGVPIRPGAAVTGRR